MVHFRKIQQQQKTTTQQKSASDCEKCQKAGYFSISSVFTFYKPLQEQYSHSKREKNIAQINGG